MSRMPTHRILLEEDERPVAWYNIAADLPEPIPPPLNPATRAPVGPEELAPLFPREIIRQEVSTERAVPIPTPVQEAYDLLNRPSPLQRALHLERVLKTPARIYFKREDQSPTGSHKPNTAFAQAHYALEEGVERLVTETGAGQWGSALALAARHFGLGATVFMVRASFNQKPYRRHLMHLYGAEVHPSPSGMTEFGARLLQEAPDHPGSLGVAISEALEHTVHTAHAKYSLGSVLNHVLLHQSVIGLETIRQFEKADVTPDVMIGCVGGGSNFGGFAYPMIGEKLRGRYQSTEFVAVEPTAVPSMTKGRYEYDFADTAQMTPLLKMHTLGSAFVPSPIHAGGLRYHGCAPSLSLLLKLGLVRPVSVSQAEAFEAGRLFAAAEGIIPAPESAHAVRVAIDLALAAKRTGEEKVIAFNLSGNGLLDLGGYAEFLEGTLAEPALGEPAPVPIAPIAPVQGAAVG